jgi:hypothetical protein
LDRCHDSRAGSKLLGRRRFLERGLTATAMAGVPVSAVPNQAADSAAEVSPFELDGVGLAELQEGMRTGKWTARALVEKYLARIAAIDRTGPALRSVIEVNPGRSGSHLEIQLSLPSLFRLALSLGANLGSPRKRQRSRLRTRNAGLTMLAA